MKFLKGWKCCHNSTPATTRKWIHLGAWCHVKARTIAVKSLPVENITPLLCRDTLQMSAAALITFPHQTPPLARMEEKSSLGFRIYICSRFPLSLVSQASLSLTAMNKIFPFYPGFVSCLMWRLASHWKTKQRASAGFELFDRSCTTLMAPSSWWEKKSFNQCSNMIERGGLAKKEETSALSNKQTNRRACFCPQCRRQASGFRGLQCTDVNRMAAILKRGEKNVMGELSFMCTRTQYTSYTSLTDSLRGVIEERIPMRQEIDLFPLFSVWLTYNI